ncbi:MAG: type II secretion system protein [Planctomycetes bacterium]|nr:type II secretion system protein [Planctomycetota bacterium]
MLRPALGRSPVGRRAPGAGFTLIELLVVIAVISLLAAFLGVAVMGARNKAQVEAAKGLINRVSTGLTIYQGRYSAYPPVDPLSGPPSGDGAAAFGYGIVAASVAPADPAQVWGLAYDRSAYLNFYLGAILYSFEGFRGGNPTVRKHNDPCIDLKLSDLGGGEAGKNPKFTPATPGAGLNPPIVYPARNGACLRRIIDPWGNPLGFRGQQSLNAATGQPNSDPARANNHTGWQRKQSTAATAAATSSADNRRSFDIWSLGADGVGGPGGADCGSPNKETGWVMPPAAPTVAPPGSTQLSTWDDINNWLP